MSSAPNKFYLLNANGNPLDEPTESAVAIVHLARRKRLTENADGYMVHDLDTRYVIPLQQFVLRMLDFGDSIPDNLTLADFLT